MVWILEVRWFESSAPKQWRDATGSTIIRAILNWTAADCFRGDRENGSQLTQNEIYELVHIVFKVTVCA